jgi:hypothetical protein
MSCRLTKTRWKILIGLFVIIDIIQIILNGFAIGLVVNRYLNIAIGVALPLFFQTQGVSMVNKKRFLGMLGAFGIEMIPFADLLPVWTADIVFTWSTVKAEEALAKVPGGKIVAGAIARNQESSAQNSPRSGPPPLPEDRSSPDTNTPINSPQPPDRTMQDIRPRV